uniref:multiple organellar RNA editing factor 5, chloroplastic/mitochondrial-like n=1 Tax=Erigeron canadensis TaxID=72917 RepID=UPI001CB9A8CD|nr:multiple organellar RNA editing factor 5, chloroplastic/mitochondrial-like [Erigeron canadensis]
MTASAIGRSVLKFRSSSLTKSFSQILKPSPIFLLHSLRPLSDNSKSLNDDYNYWHVHMERQRPGGVCFNKQQMIDFYVQTLATVLGSEEEAKKKIYKVNIDSFGCEINKETSNKLEGLPGVTLVAPEKKDDYESGAEAFVNGEIVSSPKK